MDEDQEFDAQQSRVRRYRIVKWSPEQPAARQPAIAEVYTDLALAEAIKAELEQTMPHRCFAVEPIDL
jgi:hypothetical protein